MSELTHARAFQPSIPGRTAQPETDGGAELRHAEVQVQDGRYAGANSEVAIELRVDCAGCGVLSGDIYRISHARHYVASFRTEPGSRVQWSGEWLVIGQDEHDRRARGTLWLTVQEDLPGTLAGRIEFEGALEGLPARKPIPFVAELASPRFRSVGLEMEVEEGVRRPGAYNTSGRQVTIETALEAAGFDVHTTGMQDSIPTVEGGWQMAQLHALMTDLAQAPLLARAWELHLLLLSRSDRSGLLGVMFDSADALPRQGCAVFAEEIRAIGGIDTERKLIQTTVHELGHALNLAHRFERVVGRADSTSFMNYDWRYRGGRRTDEFWTRFAFTFDADELEFLRHAPLAPLIPGGEAFHSVAYWSEGTGGYSPYVPESPLPGWQLSLVPPTADGLLQFAQPVFLTIILTNVSGRTVEAPKFLLDPKAGFLEIMIRRVRAGAAGAAKGQAEIFSPAVQRCFHWEAAKSARLNHGQSMQDNINLTFGSGGFAFAEPGTYDITALLVLFDEDQQREFIVKSNTVRLRIATPKSDADERTAMDFFSPDVGLYMALGGSAVLENARDKLLEIIDRRRGDLHDPMVAYITRAIAIDDSRKYVRYAAGKFDEREARKLGEATEALEALTTVKASALDPATQRTTATLAQRCRARLDGKATDQTTLVAPQILSAEESRHALRQIRHEN